MLTFDSRAYQGGKAKQFTVVKPRRHGSTRYNLTYRQFSGLNCDRGIIAWYVVLSAVQHVGFCNTTDVNLIYIVHAKWLNSFGIVSQLSFTMQAPWDLGKQLVTYPSCAALIWQQQPGHEFHMAVRRDALQAYSYMEK